MPSKARISHTTCDACGSALLVKVQVTVPNVRRARARIRRKAPDVEAVLAEVKRALGVRKKRKDAGQPKPKRKVRSVAEALEATPKGRKQAKAKGVKGIRPCGCGWTGRHKKTCTLATDHVAPKGWTKSENAAAKLANANKASPDGEGPRKALSPKGKAAIAALDPVRKPIKAGA